jgi:hypothetical protein
LDLLLGESTTTSSYLDAGKLAVADQLVYAFDANTEDEGHLSGLQQ